MQSENNLRKARLAARIIAATYKGPLGGGRRRTLQLTLAGGALRDLDCGGEIKDLDFFTTADVGFYSMTFRNTLSDAAGKDVTISKLGLDDKAYKHPLIYSVWRAVIEGTEVNFIVTKCPVVDFIMEGFDFNICKTYLDENNKWIRPHDYLYDRNMHCITYSPSESNAHSKWHSLYKHLPRIQAKYPGYTYRGPVI